MMCVLSFTLFVYGKYGYSYKYSVYICNHTYVHVYMHTYICIHTLYIHFYLLIFLFLNKLRAVYGFPLLQGYKVTS